MKDRVPLYPGRVKLTPVSGQENTYDMVRADQPTQEGTALNKNSLLKDTTAALYGLGADAVPDDVFAWLGKYNEYFWRRRVNSTNEVKTNIQSNTQLVNNSYQTLIYGASVSYSQGTISINNPTTVYPPINIAGAQQVASYAPCYMKSPIDGKIYYLPAGATGGNVASNTIYYIDGNGYLMMLSGANVVAQSVSFQNIVGEWEYIYSINRNAYPDSGTHDGYEYEYLGVPFEKLPTAPKIETGSYVGTGTYGSSNPNSLTFDFEPKLVFISGTSVQIMLNLLEKTENSFNMLAFGFQNGATIYEVYRSHSGNTVSWYASDVTKQINNSGSVFNYIAIG